MSTVLFSCNDEKPPKVEYDLAARYAIPLAGFFANSADSVYLQTPPQDAAAFAEEVSNSLLNLHPDFSGTLNGMDITALSELLATDILPFNTTEPPDFATLNGRGLAEDAGDVMLGWIYAGMDGTENPALSRDNVDANDAAFSNTFPYLAEPW